MLIFVALMTPRSELLALDVYLIKSFMGMEMSPFIHPPPPLRIGDDRGGDGGGGGGGGGGSGCSVVVDRVVWERMDSCVYSFFHSNNRCKTCEYVYVALVQYIFRNKNTTCLNILSKI